MKEIMRYLSETIGPRFGGTEGEHDAAQFLYDAFKAEGVDVGLQKYDFIGWRLVAPPVVTALSPEARTFSSAPIIYSGSTPKSGATGRIERHGIKQIIPGLYDMRTYALRTEGGDLQALLVAADHGAAIPLLNPDPMYRTPLIAIGAEDAGFLDSNAGGAGVVATVTIETALVPDATAYNVIARYRGQGAPHPDRRFVVDAHYDTQMGTPGCYDNASGVAGLFGLLRRLKSEGFSGNVDFIAVASEEIGLFGSSYLARDLVERGEIGNIEACICFDQISAGDTLWLWAGPDDFQEQVLDSAHAAGLHHLGDVRMDAPMQGCDMWPFWVEGVPSALFMWWRLPDYHKPSDTIDKVDMAKVDGCVDAAWALLSSLAETGVRSSSTRTAGR